MKIWGTFLAISAVGLGRCGSPKGGPGNPPRGQQPAAPANVQRNPVPAGGTQAAPQNGKLPSTQPGMNGPVGQVNQPTVQPTQVTSQPPARPQVKQQGPQAGAQKLVNLPAGQQQPVVTQAKAPTAVAANKVGGPAQATQPAVQAPQGTPQAPPQGTPKNVTVPAPVTTPQQGQAGPVGQPAIPQKPVGQAQQNAQPQARQEPGQPATVAQPGNPPVAVVQPPTTLPTGQGVGTHQPTVQAPVQTPVGQPAQSVSQAASRPGQQTHPGNTKPVAGTPQGTPNGPSKPAQGHGSQQGVPQAGANKPAGQPAAQVSQGQAPPQGTPQQTPKATLNTVPKNATVPAPGATQQGATQKPATQQAPTQGGANKSTGQQANPVAGTQQNAQGGAKPATPASQVNKQQGGQTATPPQPQGTPQPGGKPTEQTANLQGTKNVTTPGPTATPQNAQGEGANKPTGQQPTTQKPATQPVGQAQLAQAPGPQVQQAAAPNGPPANQGKQQQDTPQGAPQAAPKNATAPGPTQPVGSKPAPQVTQATPQVGAGQPATSATLQTGAQKSASLPAGQPPAPPTAPQVTAGKVEAPSADTPAAPAIRPHSTPPAKPPADVATKVDGNLFTTELGNDGGVPTLKLTVKTGATANKLTFDNKDLWTGQQGCSCSEATFYFGSDNAPVCASFKYKNASNQVVEGHRQFDGEKWTQAKKDDLQAKLNEIKQHSGAPLPPTSGAPHSPPTSGGPVTPSITGTPQQTAQKSTVGATPDKLVQPTEVTSQPTVQTTPKETSQQPVTQPANPAKDVKLDVGSVDGGVFGVSESKSGQITKKTLTPKDGHRLTEVSDGQESLWKGGQNEHANNVLLYYTGNSSSLATVTYVKGDGKTTSRCYIKQDDGSWEWVEKTKYDAKLAELKGEDTGNTATPPENVKQITVHSPTHPEGSKHATGTPQGTPKNVPDPQATAQGSQQAPPQAGANKPAGQPAGQPVTPAANKVNGPVQVPPQPIAQVQQGAPQASPTVQATPQEATKRPLSPLVSKVDGNLFTAQPGMDDGVHTLKLTAKDGVTANKLTFGNETIWEDKKKNCTSATIYLKRGGPHVVLVQYKDGKKDKTVHLHHDGTKWKDKKDEYDKKLKALKESVKSGSAQVDRKSNIKADLFNVQESDTSGIPCLTCTPKDGKTPNTLVYGSETIWNGNKKASCKSATIYFDGAEPHLVTLTVKEEKKDEQTLFLSYDGRKWKDDKDEHGDKLKALMEAGNSKPVVKLDVSAVDGGLFDAKASTEKGLTIKTFTPKDGIKPTEVSESSATIWKAENEKEHTKTVLVHYNGGAPILATVTYAKPDGKNVLRCYIKQDDGTWKWVGKEEYDKKLNEVAPLILDLANPESSICKSFEVNIQGAPAKVYAVFSGIDVTKIVHSGKTVWTSQGAESCFYCASFLKNGSPPVTAIRIKGQELSQSFCELKGDKLEHSQEGNDANLNNLRTHKAALTKFSLDLSTTSDTDKCKVTNENKNGTTARAYAPKVGHHIEEVKDGQASVWKTEEGQLCYLCEYYSKGGVTLLRMHLESNYELSLLCYKKSDKWEGITGKELNNELVKWSTECSSRA